MKKIMFNLMLLFACSLVFASIASAHVVVYPKETTQGAYEKFTVRVPSEKDIPTVKVEVKFPLDAVSVSRFEPKAGWKYDIAKDASGKITGVTWTATGDGLSATEFGEFNMSGKVADSAAVITWKAYQTYKDGSVVEWTGAEGSDKPASVTTVMAKPASAAADSHGDTQTVADHGVSSSSNMALYLSIAAAVLGALSLIISLVRKKA